MRISRILAFFVALSAFSTTPCWAVNWTSDGSALSVQANANRAANGDTITLPPGTFTWGSGVTITKAITLQGLGNVTNDGNGRTTACGTIIKDNVASGPLISWTLPASALSRITSIEFQNGGRSSIGYGILSVNGSNTNGSQFRMDHCKWNELNGFPIYDTVIGVVDHSTFVWGTKQEDGVFIYGRLWDGHTNGDGSWSAATNYGSPQWLFFEDCNFQNSNPTASQPATDAYSGARFVVRNCSLFNCWIANHGTESNGRGRGGRAMEIYNNVWTGTNQNSQIGGTRSGGMLWHDNTISGFSSTPGITMTNFRTAAAFDPWGQADGSNPWDVNAGGAPLFTGTANGASVVQPGGSVRTKVTVSGSQGWTTNQWRGYTIHRTSNLAHVNSVTSAMITDSDANSITYYSAFVLPLTLASGDTMEFRKVNQVLDGVGRALGSLVGAEPTVIASGSNGQRLPQSTINVRDNPASLGFPPSGTFTINLQDGNGAQKISYTGIGSNSFTGCTGGTGTLATNQNIQLMPAGWNDQVTEPCYAWNNGAAILGSPDQSVPATNYVSGAMPNYTPYIYPHPLVNGGGAAGPGAPQNLHVMQ